MSKKSKGGRNKKQAQTKGSTPSFLLAPARRELDRRILWWPLGMKAHVNALRIGQRICKRAAAEHYRAGGVAAGALGRAQEYFLSKAVLPSLASPSGFRAPANIRHKRPWAS